MKRRNAEFLMAAVVLARSTSFIMSKTSLDSLEPMNLLGVRFIIAFILLLTIFRKKIVGIKSRTIRNGIIIGVIYTAVMASEMMGLKYADSSKVAFLENSAIVFVPFAEIFIRRKLPGRLSFLCTFMALAGVGFLTLTEGFSELGRGEAYSLLAALLYTAAIIVTDRLSKNDDGLMLGIVQVGTMGVVSMTASFLTETPVLPQTGSDWLMIMWLAVVCTGFGFTLQPLAQKYITSQRSSTITALNPLGAGVLGALTFHENLGLKGCIGALLVLAGVLLQSKGEEKNAENR